ncbi:hypothetical protein FDP41_010674 [Naegleria fowleri]|uniref:DUF4116 domain-containing protein n=1 Tax=Naegleria fowleri TaxID=5763 RepID=A0A6A5CE75_NAEFO|nr:uncharacterized protein FDP41_010674 [Naegleria fowleri]KAF0983609.1 hypothetical protein FDP41_010674 [Naegleria fowleri]
MCPLKLVLLDFSLCVSPREDECRNDEDHMTCTLPSNDSSLKTNTSQDDELLRHKFTLQQIGKKKYLENREKIYTEFFPVEFMNDKSFVLDHLKKYQCGLGFATKQVKQDKQVELVALEIIKTRQLKPKLNKLTTSHESNDDELFSPKNISSFTDLKNEFMLKAIKRNPYLLVSLGLQQNKDIILAVLEQTIDILDCTPKEFFEDKDFMLRAVTKNGLALHYTSPALLYDKEIVLAAVKQNGKALFAASHLLRDDKEVVMEAVRQTGTALQYASFRLQHDREVIMEAVELHGYVTEFSQDLYRARMELCYFNCHLGAK